MNNEIFAASKTYRQIVLDIQIIGVALITVILCEVSSIFYNIMINKIKIHKKNIKNIFQQALYLNSSSRIVHERVVNLYADLNDIHIIAIGKSAPTMLEGALTALGDKFTKALLITKDNCGSGKLSAYTNIQTIIAGHPIPDKQSLRAGKVLIQFLQKLEKISPVLFLISGGASSLVEYFSDDVTPKISSMDLFKLNRWLLASDQSIVKMNQIRKRISGIKAGKLIDYINSENVIALYISDVPDDGLNNIGSGLLVREDITKKIRNLPDWVNQLISNSECLPFSDDNPKNITSHIVFSNRVLRKSIIDVANEYGYSETNNMDEFISGNTIEDAQRIGKWLKNQEKGFYVWGAETHMSLPENPGIGGRNQSFALALAKEIQNCSQIIVLLAGTDGNDGNTSDTGAIIDGLTIQRGELNGASVEVCLREANAGVFLSASGDKLTLGSTGTNVMDIIIALILD